MPAVALAAALVSLAAAFAGRPPQPVSPAPVPAPSRPSDQPAPQFRYGAHVDVKSFAYVRDIAAPPGDVVELHLDAAVLAHSAPDLADVRVATADGRQVPYLMNEEETPLTIQLPPLEREQLDSEGAARGRRANVSRYLVLLPYAHLPSAQLIVRTPERVFRRDVRLEMRSPDEHGGNALTVLREHSWSNTSWYGPVPTLAFYVASLPTTQLHLVVDEGDNAPLPLDRPTLTLPAYRLRFARPAGVALQLAYGNRSLDAPRYDVALVPHSLLDAPAVEGTLAPEHAAPASRVPARFAFWAALALAVVILGGLIARLLRANPV